jgi:NADPH:quinone reductase-like Zn-dependent oxidoreductase
MIHRIDNLLSTGREDAMRAFQLEQFGLEHLRAVEQPAPRPGPGEVLLTVKALSLNYRDLLVIRGQYNPKLRLPAAPISDAAGVVAEVGPGVTRLHPGDAVMTHYVSTWHDGPFRQEYLGSTLGMPGPGFAAEQAVVSAEALLPLPRGYSFAEAATLPIAALTAWSALVTEGQLQPGQNVLTLGTGGVSIFAVQLAAVLGARVLITSSSDEKLARAKALGAAVGINYRTTPDWERRVLAETDGQGADLTVENGGPGTLDQSMKATRSGGLIALLGALTGLSGPVTTGLILMRRLRIHGILVDSRANFERLVSFLDTHRLRPVIDERFPFEELPAALRRLESGAHFGKLVVEL